ncbi:MAG: DUF262 domain-containing protein [Bacteroidales bacterium]|nr:DUF262 domain-containing protein [Bacteroidales bacterium]
MKNIFNEEVDVDNMSAAENERPLALVSVKQILEKKLKFFVPAYQRGYRWRPEEIEVLIDDLARFMKEEGDKAADYRCPFYCLQSVVVKNCESKQLEVIDGQQRLTTILILLNALNTIEKEDNFKMRFEYNDLRKEHCAVDLFEIKYETRESSDKWLFEITEAYINDICNGDANSSAELKNKNSDYYHFIEAYLKSIDLIKAWEKVDRNNFEKMLKEQTRFIWYNTSLVDAKDNEIDIFDRINATKIELNNAELIKALLLQKDNYGTETQLRDQMAIDWDNIEKRLQDPSFWGFVYSTKHPYHYSTHIEYIFDILQNKTTDYKDYYYYTFNCYYKQYPRESKDRLNYVKDCWKSIQEMMLMLEEWYSDKICYHYIGYLLEYGKTEKNGAITIPYLKDILVGIPKDQRAAKLKELVKNSLKDIKPTQLFHGNGTGITQLLFLLNIQSEQNRKSETARFSFSSYKQIKDEPGWNEEHVASNTDYVPKYEEKEGLAYALFEYFTGVAHTDEMNFDDYKQKVMSMYPSDGTAKAVCDKIWLFFDFQNTEELQNAYADIMTYFDAKGEEEFKDDVVVGKGTKREKDFIWNFALLNATTNKSYGNDIYPLKRKRIMSDEYYIYTPICTRALFEKAYSQKLSNLMIWGRSDAKDYWDYICNCLSDFLPDNFDIPFTL